MQEPLSDRRIGVYGGTFDPVHWGHLLAAEHARESLDLETIVFLPARQSPLKPDRRPAMARHRIAMLELSLFGNDRFRLDTCELEREGVSYTVDTLRALRQAHPQWDIHLLLGADAIVDFDKWKAPDRLAPWTDSLPASRRPQAVRIPQIEISSREIRAHVRAGRSIRYLVHPAVEAYIAEHHLYADP